MAQNAGTVYAEIRIALDKLESDIAGVRTRFRHMDQYTNAASTTTSNRFTVMGKQVGKSMEQLSNTVVGQFAKMAQGMQKAINAAPIIGLIMMIVGAVKKLVSGVVDWMKETSGAYIKNQQEIAKLNAVIQTTGAVAWTSTRQITDLAKTIASETGKTTEEVMKMQSVLLGFTSVTGEAFTRASKAIVDMSAVMGGDLSGGAQTLGKALDNPIEGMAALRKQGFFFTDEQKEQIRVLEESGQHLEAQRIILDSVEQAFGGVAKAVNDVNSAQSRLAEAEERVKVAQGERTTGLVSAWTSWRADMKENKAAMLEFNNAVAKAQKADYSQQTAQIEALRKNLERASGEVEKLAAKHLVVKAEFELDREQANDQMVLAQKQLEDYAAEMGIYQNATDEAMDSEYRRLQENYNEWKKKVTVIDEAIAKEDEAAAARVRQAAQEEADNKKLEEQEYALAAAKAATVKAYEEIGRAERMGMLTALQANQQRMTAAQTEVNAINQIISATERLTLVTDQAKSKQTSLITGLNEAMQTSVSRYTDIYDKLSEGLIKPPITSEELLDRRALMEETFKRTERVLKNMYETGIIEEQEYNKQVISARQAMASSLQKMLEESGLTAQRNPITYKMLSDEITAINTYTESLQKAADEEKRLADSKAGEIEMAKAIKDMNFAYLQTTGSIKEVRAAEKQRALEAIINSDEYRDASDDTKKKVVKAFEQMWEAAHSKDPFKAWQESLQYLGQAIQAFGQLFTAVMQKSAQFQMKALEETYKAEQKLMEELYAEKMRLMEEDYQNQLYYAGLAKAVTEEQFDAELEKAIATGDHRAIYRAEKEKKEFEIKSAYEKKKADAEREAQKEREDAEKDYQARKAEIEYKAALAQWAISLASTAASIAQGIMMAFAQLGILGGPAGAAMVGGIGAVQMAAVIAARPEKALFDSGGIVAGDPYRGDATAIMARGGEAMLTKEDQQNLFDMIRGGEQKQQNATFIIELDGEVIAQKVFEIGSLGNAFMRGRGVIR